MWRLYLHFLLVLVLHGASVVEFSPAVWEVRVCFLVGAVFLLGSRQFVLSRWECRGISHYGYGMFQKKSRTSFNEVMVFFVVVDIMRACEGTLWKTWVILFMTLHSHNPPRVSYLCSTGVAPLPGMFPRAWLSDVGL